MADALQKEASLPVAPPMGPPVTPVGRRQSSYSAYTPTHPGSAMHHHHHRQFSQVLSSPSSSTVRRPLQLIPRNSSVSSAGAHSAASGTPASNASSPASAFTSRLYNAHSTSLSPVFIRQKTGGGGAYLPSPVLRKLQPRSLMPQPPKVTLDSIVTDYLRKQHAICRNPVVVCPPFSLFDPHRCPEPRHKRSAPASITARLLNRSAFPQYGGLNGRSLDRKLIHSKFRPVRTYRDSEQDGTFTSVAFSQCQQWLFFGTYAGEMKLYNIDAATEFMSKECHDAAIT